MLPKSGYLGKATICYQENRVPLGVLCLANKIPITDLTGNSRTID